MSDAAVTHLPAPGTVTMFTTTWCGYCRRLKSQMEREGISFTEVDIEHEPGTAEFVMSVNGGNQTVPTLLFAVKTRSLAGTVVVGMLLFWLAGTFT